MRHHHSGSLAVAVLSTLVLVAPPAQAAPSVGKELRRLEASFHGRIGAYALDTGTGRSVGYRAGSRFPFASSFKVFAAAAVLHKASTSDPGLMERVIRWTAKDVKPNSPVTGKHLKDGLTVARLCEAAITVSDNTAANLLLKQIGGPAGMTRYFRSLKDQVSRLDRWETDMSVWKPGERRDTTTATAAATSLRTLTLGNALSVKDRDRLVGWLRANQTGGNRIRAGLPKSWVIGDKTGTTSGYGGASDIAVIWPDKGASPIVMAVYTTRNSASAPMSEPTIARTATILARGLGRLP
ncbi:MAG: class A beta-lactamase [Nonomuraea sp.]|nr:class A beta-lactamase [Nonomuraea sp.]